VFSFCLLFLSAWSQDGVIFALSGLVNPERANIREIAIQMGAHYRPDWTADCTLLVCAFANTPKFNQVKNDNGTIVSKVLLFAN
jgi:DNA-repair protein XRCC1